MAFDDYDEFRDYINYVNEDRNVPRMYIRNNENLFNSLDEIEI